MTDSAALISTEDLARRLGAPALRIFDCTTYLKPGPDGRYIAESGRANYDNGHVPGAAYLDLAADLSDKKSPLRFTLPPLEELTRAFAAKGIGHGTFVVLYSHASPVWATRIWWMLRTIGFDDAVILDGGLDKWRAENRPLSDTPSVYPPATLTLRARPEIFVGKEEVKAAIGRPDTLTINALSQEQHKGSGGVTYGRPGRIAGSSCVPAASLFGPDKTLKPIAALRTAFEGIGAAPDKRLLVYCGGGIAATLDAFVLTAILGHKNVSVYDNSMQEWSNDESLPMETG
ncbi:thiosulfate/3-mercaptopyruvate sulfurtransferase [Enhydrobacter aerosaccus]|uniref:Thiosulfate/3-mercaptopyruvate sulfurtransferase n=1 Tax=Enhydrobacter aerosaccus TaxID=225324 RepID=A0A1T4T162_9HYPH|nr:sulfurtransferase [Enhydrobacter aerosaccus]SKA33981.1 thiosulfate/3-mercaptopyruvate sulfurtransferase [Enhydrobacter aerosaccus]